MAWERSFQKRVNDIRTDELHWQAVNYKIEVAFNALWEITPVLVTVVAFLVSCHHHIPHFCQRPPVRAGILALGIGNHLVRALLTIT